MRYVDIGIPANNKGKHSIGCLFWLLARMVLQMRGTIRPGSRWEVMVNHSFIVIRNWGGVLWAAISGIKEYTKKEDHYKNGPSFITTPFWKKMVDKWMDGE
ncbi:40S ribosomal protein SA-like isoform X3 [Quercus lobata]|uniref:40S ribosomal protein SA-like isoform X3 n=1 Tax=Quercus lobata TaxID=97700 RepID=UPI0012491F09|nr:40S ribosomal protein SA-like isoform X3 [Quercus lobata]